MPEDESAGRPKPYWQPKRTLSENAYGLQTQPSTNWLSPEDRKGFRQFDATSSLLDGALTEADVRLAQSLKLDPRLFNPFVCAKFAQLVRVLPDAMRPNGCVQSVWVDELLCMLPSCGHIRMNFDSPLECAKTYIERGEAPLLMLLYLLALRSNAWIRRIQRCTIGPMRPLQPVPEELTKGYDIQELIGDPCATSQLRNGWTEGFMEARENFFASYVMGDERNAHAQDLLFTLEVIVYVISVLVPDMEDATRHYASWVRQL